LFFNFGLEYAIIRVQVNDGLKLNGTHQHSVYADDGNTLRESIHTTRKKKKKNTKALVNASNENGLRVNADKTQYMAMSQDQTAG